MDLRKNVLPFPVLLIIIAVAAIAVTLFQSPTVCSGQWASCANAFGDNANRAEFRARDTINGTGTWQDYSFVIPSTAQIDSVVVRADFFASNTKGKLDVRVSGDGGATYGPAHVVGGNTAEQTFLIDVTNDVAWTPTKLDNTNLKVKAICFKSPTGGADPRCRLDWIPVTVNYTNQTNSTNTTFDFSVSAVPTSAAVNQGQGATSTVTVTLLTGNPQNVALSHSGCPPSTACTFNPTGGSPTYQSTFTAMTNPSVPNGVYPITLTGTGGGLMRSTVFTLTVNATNTTNSTNATFDFSVAVSQAFGNINVTNATNATNTTSTTVTVSLLSGTPQQVTLSQTGCPPFSTCSFTPSSGLPTYTSTFSVMVAPITPPGTYPITLTGTGGLLTRDTLYTVTVN